MNLVAYVVPKSGTKLLDQILRDLRIGSVTHIPLKKNPLNKNDVLFQKSFTWLKKRIQFDKSKIRALVFRDTRDQLISMTNFYIKGLLIQASSESERQKIFEENFVKILKINNSSIIDHEDRISQRALVVRKMMDVVLNVMNNKNKHSYLRVVRFETLVGERYGGVKESKRVSRLMWALDLNNKGINRKQLKAVLNRSSEGAGKSKNTFTLEPQKVGQWKRYFKPHHVDLFKKYWNQYLIGYGYEDNSDWDLECIQDSDQRKVM